MSGESPLAAALALTQAMLGAAQSADWERLIALEAERHPLVMQPMAQNEDSVRLLGELLELDRELYRLITRARDHAAEKWQAEHDRARAIAAYGA